MTEIEISVSSAIGRSALYEALKEAWPSAEFRETNGLEAKSFGPLPEWVIQASILVTVTGELSSTVQGLRTLANTVSNLRRDYPRAPRAALRIVDRDTQDTIELENADPSVMKDAIDSWLDSHS